MAKRVAKVVTMDLKMQLSAIAHRYLPERRFAQLRGRYLAFRSRFGFIEKRLRGSFNTDDLRKHLEQRIVRDFEILMVHSSLNGMKPTYDGDALQLLRMLIEYCGPERTLAMPAFFFGDPNIGSLNETLKLNPYFDMRRAPSQMGLVTELFRRSKGVVQSRHAAYRISALGPLAMEMTTGHETASGPAGLGSPFEFMAKHKTLVLGVGKSFEVMTQVHHVEGAMGDEFPVPRVADDERHSLKVIFVEGQKETPATLATDGVQGRFNILKLPSLLPAGQLTCWKFHGVPFFMADAGEVTRSLIAAAGEGKTLYDQ